MKNDDGQQRGCKNSRRVERAEIAADAAAKHEFALAEIDKIDRLTGHLAQQHRDARRKLAVIRHRTFEQAGVVEGATVAHRHRERIGEQPANLGKGRRRTCNDHVGLIGFLAVREQGLTHRVENRRGRVLRDRRSVGHHQAGGHRAQRARRSSNVDQHDRGGRLVAFDHQVRHRLRAVAVSVFRAREHGSQRERRERDGLRIESGLLQQIEVLLEICLAYHRGHHERAITLAPDAGKCDGAIVDRERQMLFQRERDDLMQPARILERQFEQSLDDAIDGQRRNHDVRLASLDHQARQRAAEIGFVVGANLVVHAGESERIPRALGDGRAHAIAALTPAQVFVEPLSDLDPSPHATPRACRCRCSRDESCRNDFACARISPGPGDREELAAHINVLHERWPTSPRSGMFPMSVGWLNGRIARASIIASTSF